MSTNKRKRVLVDGCWLMPASTSWGVLAAEGFGVDDLGFGARFFGCEAHQVTLYRDGQGTAHIIRIDAAR